jgi:hypothetical protein
VLENLILISADRISGLVEDYLNGVLRRDNDTKHPAISIKEYFKVNCIQKLDYTSKFSD